MKLENTEKARKLLGDRIELMDNIESLNITRKNRNYNIKIRVDDLFCNESLEMPMSDKVVEFAIAEMRTKLANIEIEILEL